MRTEAKRSSIKELFKDEVGKLSLEKLTKKIMDLIVQLLPIITPLILNQFIYSLPKNVTNFHRQQDSFLSQSQ